MTSRDNSAGADPRADAMTDWATRAAALAEELVAAGKLSSPAWRAAVGAVPRHVFVPVFHRYREGRMIPVHATDPAWAEQVYANTALITKITETDASGMPEFLSSSSTPGLMTRMLEALDIQDGHRVLEIGTGTGYNAALLCHRLGEQGVFSIDIEPDLVTAAAARLADLGYHPTLSVGDGAAGLAEHAPYDRVIATCSVPAVPWPWVEQLHQGGVLITDIKVGVAAGNLIRVTRTAEQRAEGSFDAGYASFMELRHAPGAGQRVPYTRRGSGDAVAESRTTLDPRTPWSNPVVWFLAALRIGGHYRLGYTGTDPQHHPDAVSISTPDGSRTEITIQADSDAAHIVRESGPTRVWHHVENAHRQWCTAGQPPWPRLGLLVTPDTQTLYVDDPSNTLMPLTNCQDTSPQATPTQMTR